MSVQKIICIIPAYNEEKNIAKTVNDVKKIVSDVVVIDDGSNDNTARLAKREGALVLRHIINRGQGAALQTGNEYALKNKADIVVHFDADGQFVAEEINEMVDPIKKGQADIVFGSRFLNKESNLPFYKKNILFPFARIINKILIGRSFADPQNGFRALSGKAIKSINISNDGMAHNSEIQYKAFKNKLVIKEVAVTVFYNNYGQGMFSGKGSGAGGIKIIKDLIIQRIIN